MKSVLAVLTLLTIALPLRAIPLITDPGEQLEPDIYGRYVVYRDRSSCSAYGCAVYAYDLQTHSKELLNPDYAADNNPAVGENRAIWCDRRWDGSFGIVSTVIGSGVEDVLTHSGGSTWGLDVNDRWAIWWGISPLGPREVCTYNFTSRSVTKLAYTISEGDLFDQALHLEHGQDVAMWRDQSGLFWKIDLATGTKTQCSASEYDRSQHGVFGGAKVWCEWLGDSQSDIYYSHAPEPSSLVAFVCGAAALFLIRRRGRPNRADSNSTGVPAH